MEVTWEQRAPFVKQPRDYIALFIRRRKLFILPALAVFAGAVALAYLLPPVYQSTATVLIEEPEVPRDLVQSTVSSFADQRLQSIRQRVMTTANLTSIMDQYNLYEETRTASWGAPREQPGHAEKCPANEEEYRSLIVIEHPRRGEIQEVDIVGKKCMIADCYSP